MKFVIRQALDSKWYVIVRAGANEPWFTSEPHLRRSDAWITAERMVNECYRSASAPMDPEFRPLDIGEEGGSDYRPTARPIFPLADPHERAEIVEAHGAEWRPDLGDPRTGAERYLAGRLTDPEYAAAFEQARAHSGEES